MRRTVFAALAIMLGLASGRSASPDGSVFLGRWQEENPQESMTIGTLEITPCGKDLCGRIVKDRVCGPPVLKVTFVPPEASDVEGRFEGELMFDGVQFDASLAYVENILVLNAIEKATIYERGLATSFSFRERSPAQCPPLPLS